MGASNSARAMDNFTNEVTMGCLSKNDEDFLLFSPMRDFFDKKNVRFDSIFTYTSTMTLLRLLLLRACEAVSTTTSARALLAKHHVVFQTDPGGSHDESTGGIGDVAFLLGRRRLRGLERRESGVEHFLRPL